jgi:hypothetical protein
VTLKTREIGFLSETKVARQKTREEDEKEETIYYDPNVLKEMQIVKAGARSKGARVSALRALSALTAVWESIDIEMIGDLRIEKIAIAM